MKTCVEQGKDSYFYLFLFALFLTLRSGQMCIIEAEISAAIEIFNLEFGSSCI